MRDRIEGGILGLLVGDALGVPYEFKSARDIPELEMIEMTPPEGYRRTYPDVPPGTWSDDGAQALALLASLLACDGLDLDDLGERFLGWYERGEMTPDGNRFDVGIQTSEALQSIRSGTPAEKAGSTDERRNGNGSLMRVLPLALWHRGGDEELVADAMRQSLVTHGHLRSQLCCALYTLWARRTMQEHPDPWGDAVATLRGIHPEGTAERTELETHIRPDERGTPVGSGYVVASLHAARWAVEQGRYETVVRSAIALGDDTDTTACIAGGIAGIRDGVAAIPERWRTQLRGMEIVAPLVDGLVARVSTETAA